MKSEKEIKEMYQHCIDTDGLVSPSAMEALEWVLEMEGNYDFLFSLSANKLKQKVDE